MNRWGAQAAVISAAGLGSAAWMTLVCAGVRMPVGTWAIPVLASLMMGMVAWYARPKATPFRRSALSDGATVASVGLMGAALFAVPVTVRVAAEAGGILPPPLLWDVALASLGVGLPCGVASAASATLARRILAKAVDTPDRVPYTGSAPR